MSTRESDSAPRMRDKLKAARLRAGITSRELAEALGYKTTCQYSRIESGKVNCGKSIDKLVSACDYIRARSIERGLPGADKITHLSLCPDDFPPAEDAA